MKTLIFATCNRTGTFEELITFSSDEIIKFINRNEDGVRSIKTIRGIFYYLAYQEI